MTLRLAMLLGGLLAFARGAAAQPAIELTLASGYGEQFLFVREITATFVPAADAELARRGDMRIAWKLALGGRLAPPAQTLAAVRDGRADIGHVPTVLNQAELPLQSVGFYAPFGTTDPLTASQAIRYLDARLPALRAAWEAQQQVPLVNFSLDGFVLMARAPVSRLADLAGKRVGGSGANLNWLKGAGITGVAANAATVAADLKAGAYDAVLTSLTVASGAKLHQLAPYLLDAGFGAFNTSAITVNRKRWETLPEEVRGALQVAARQFDIRYHAALKELVERERAAMAAAGLRSASLSESDRVAWAQALPNIAREWAEAQERKGLPGRDALRLYMQFQRESGAAPARDWDRD